MCEAYSFLLSAYIDHEVTAAERAEVEAHLDGCALCRVELRVLREAAALATMLPEVAPPAGLRSRIFERTLHRRSVWARLCEGVARPVVWRSALAAGVAGATLVALYRTRPPIQIAQNPAVHKSSPVFSSRRRDLSAPKGVAALPEKPEAPPQEGRAGLQADLTPPFAQRAGPSAPRRIAPPVKPRSPVALASASTEEERSLRPPAEAQAKKHPGAKVKPRTSHAKPAEAPHPQRVVPSTKPEGEESPRSEPMSAPSDLPPMVAKAPPPETPADASASTAGPPKEPETKPEETSPSPPAGVEIVKLANRRHTKPSMEELVAELNAAAISSSPHQLKWRLAKISFK